MINITIYCTLEGRGQNILNESVTTPGKASMTATITKQRVLDRIQNRHAHGSIENKKHCN